jgi:phosphatidylserine/phosphatidylglycerophosphate/cardiolipin synthase-like enzyme
VDHFVVPNLHSKLYISEKEAIMTSMNLYEHSAKENEEIGIHTTNSELLKEIESYLEDLSKRTLSYQPGMIRKLLNKLDDIRYGPSDQGACIRCNNELKHNLKKPMCKKCFSEWLRTKEYDKSEPYCHKCSKEESTTIKMPVCKDCKNDFESQFNDDISKYTFGLY